MDSNLEKIKERIRKLLNVTEDGSGATEGEMENAIRFAVSLMNKHQLSEADLATSESKDAAYERAKSAEKGRFYATISGSFHAWESHLAVFVGKFCGVGVYCEHNPRVARYPNGTVYANVDKKSHKGKSFVFYGIAEDAAFATSLFYELWTTTYLAGMIKFGAAYKGDGGMYCQGFVQGMATANTKEQAKLRQETTGKGLILLDQQKEMIEFKVDLAKKYLAESLGIKLSKGSGYSGANGSYEAYREGKSDGARSNVERKQHTPKIG